MSESEKKSKDSELRRGWTTGACATAAAKAAYLAMISGENPNQVVISLPGGQQPGFDVESCSYDGQIARAAVIKDAGDDPDVTHGAVIRAEVKKSGRGLSFKAGPGVGTVTKPGLPLAVGEPAINPAPRQMISDNLGAVADAHDLELDLEITISVDHGEKLAAKTWNPRLGILGGISILGTTGIVIPYSCAAWIASIHQGVDVARAAGLDHVAACTGSTSEKAVMALYGLEESSILDMGDFVGGTLKYLRAHPIPKLTIAGGMGKLSKLAAGNMDLHSKRSEVDPGLLAGLAAEVGADEAVYAKIAKSETALAAFEIARENNLALGDAVALRAQKAALKEARESIAIEIIIFDRAGRLVGRAGFKE